MPMPTKLVAVTGGGASAFFRTELAHSLLTEANSLADNLGASLTTTTPKFSQQSKGPISPPPVCFAAFCKISTFWSEIAFLFIFNFLKVFPSYYLS